MIRFQGFGKRYGRTCAVEGVSFSIEAGEAVALLGPNGSGKTTTIKAAAGLLRPTAGRVDVGAPPLAAQDPAARRVLSYLPQKVAFPDSLTGREVVEFFGRLRGTDPARVPEALAVASLNGASGRAVSTYSGGMLQRLGLAVAVLPNAPVLLLDEPTAALDPDGLCAFYGLVERRRRTGHTLLFTSHQLGDVERLADRFLVLVGGKLVAEMTRSELADRLARRGVMRLRLAIRPPGLLAAVRAASPSASWAGDELIVPGPSSERPHVLDVVRRAGGEIRSLIADEGRLEDFYRELIGAAS